MGLKQLSKGTLESGKIHVSGAFGWCLISERCSNANMQMQLRFPSPHGDHGGAERGCRDYQEHRGAKGGLEDRGGYGLPRRASAGPGIAEEVLVSKTRVLVPGGHSGQSLIFSNYRLVM